MTRPPLLTKEELEMVKEAVLFPVMLDELQSDIEKVHSTDLKLNLLVVSSLKNIQDQITKDIRRLRIQLKERGIKIYDERQTSLGIQAEYKCRGYQHQLLLIWSVVRAEILRKASNYMGVILVTEAKK